MNLKDWAGVPAPSKVVLEGHWTRLEPLDPVRHGDALCAAVSGPESERLHRYLPDAPPRSREDFGAGWLKAAAASSDPLYFVVIDRLTGRIGGRQSFMDVSTEHGRAEIGHILWGPDIARSRVATEAFFLMTDYAFGLGYRRWHWRCNALNAPSRQAALRFGFQFEGIFRNHMVVKGESRDTAWLSITDAEWPDLRQAFLTWLDPANFDATGQQLNRLATSRE